MKNFYIRLPNKTIGILIVKENNEYVLYSSDGNVILRTFKLLKEKM